MAATSRVEIKKSVRIYLGVFVALLFLTLVTVGISYLHLSPTIAVIAALFVATIKGGLVAAIFMHLNHEKKIIYWVFGFAVALLVPVISISWMLCH